MNANDTDAVRELREMLRAGTWEEGVHVFDHSPEEMGLHVMENADTILAALPASPAETDAGEMRERAAVAGFLVACAETADEQRGKYAGRPQNMRNLTAEAKAYRNAARLVLEQAHASHRALPLTNSNGESEGVLAWFGADRRLSLYHYAPVYGDDDDQREEWRVDRESGSINDREWTTIGRGSTPLAALQSAASLTTQPQAGGQG